MNKFLFSILLAASTIVMDRACSQEISDRLQGDALYYEANRLMTTYIETNELKNKYQFFIDEFPEHPLIPDACIDLGNIISNRPYQLGGKEKSRELYHKVMTASDIPQSDFRVWEAKFRWAATYTHSEDNERITMKICEEIIDAPNEEFTLPEAWLVQNGQTQRVSDLNRILEEKIYRLKRVAAQSYIYVRSRHIPREDIDQIIDFLHQLSEERPDNSLFQEFIQRNLQMEKNRLKERTEMDNK